MASSPLVLGIFQPQSLDNRAAIPQGRIRVRLRIWLPVLISTIAFAVESTSYFGADRTSDPLQRMIEVFFGYGVGPHWESIHHLIRKTGHFLGYGSFCLVCFRSFWIEFREMVSKLERKLRAHGLAILATFLVATADELHQSFVPNRTGKFSDVLLDTCGGVVFGLVLFIAMRAAERRRQARDKADCRLDRACAEGAA